MQILVLSHSPELGRMGGKKEGKKRSKEEEENGGMDEKGKEVKETGVGGILVLFCSLELGVRKRGKKRGQVEREGRDSEKGEGLLGDRDGRTGRKSSISLFKHVHFVFFVNISFLNSST